MNSQRTIAGKLIRQHIKWLANEYVKDIIDTESLEQMSMHTDSEIIKREEHFRKWLTTRLTR